MTGLLLPPHQAAMVKRRAAADAIQRSSINQMASDDFVTLKEAQRQLDQLQAYIDERRSFEPGYSLPRSMGWRISVLMLTIPETTDGGLHIVEEQREARALASPQGIVLDVGESAFQDAGRFSINGQIKPWVRPGDRILWRKYDVTMFQLGNGQRLGFMNDTQGFAIIDRNWTVPQRETSDD